MYNKLCINTVLNYNNEFGSGKESYKNTIKLIILKNQWRNTIK